MLILIHKTIPRLNRQKMSNLPTCIIILKVWWLNLKSCIKYQKSMSYSNVNVKVYAQFM